MASGVQNQLGIGQAQVLDAGPSHFPLAQQLYRQKLTKEESERRNQLLRKEEEQNLYGLIGDALKLKDFNPVIHDKVRQAQSDLAKRIKTENPSYADTYLAAQNAAGELTQMSQGFNQLDQILAATKKEYEQDKRVNVANIEGIARKMALDDFNKNGRVDPSKNYFDEALNQFPEFALTDKSDYTTTKFLPEEKQSRTGKFTEINKAGRKEMFGWKADNYPIYYDFKDNGEESPPTITTRSQGEYEGMPMLSDEAYGRFKATPSNVVAVNRRIKNQYPDINLGSEEAEKLRKVEAFKDIDRQKPPVNKERLDQAAPIKSYNFMYGYNPPIPESQLNNPYKRIKELVRTQKAKGQAFTPATLLEEDTGKIVMDVVKQRMTAKEAAKATLNDYKIIEGDDGSLRIFDKNTDDFVGFIGETSADVPEQVSVKEKRQKIEEINRNKNKSNKPSKDPLKLF